MDKVRIGLIGCGNISSAYLKYAKLFDFIEVAACADIDLSRAQARATEFGVPRACAPAELLADPTIKIVVNLTTPDAHAAVAEAALTAGKNVYNEKPVALDRECARKLVRLAKSKKLRLGGAPDTFLGAGLQTCRKLIDDGAIGKPVAALCFMLGRGPEIWHPNPNFFYQPGAGPMFDMGPYYITALLNLIGPITRVSAAATVAISPRIVGSGELMGQKIEVNTPDHVAANIEFADGAVATLVTSFAVAHANFPNITIFGTNGTLAVPDPNMFDHPVKICRGIVEKTAWEDVPFTHPTGYGRMVGVADMARAIAKRRKHRASAEQVFTVLNTMQGILESAKTGRAYKVKGKYERPAPLPAGAALGMLD